MNVKRVIKRILYPNYHSNEAYISYLKGKGAIIGDGSFFYSPQKHPVDESSCPFIEIGRNCRITEGVMILAHDYSYAVCRSTHHAMLQKSGTTCIGDNVFIGINAVILMKTHIGNNCIVGAGSVVSGYFEDNVVIGGNPARVICSLDEYYQKLQRNFENDAREFYRRKSKFLNRPLAESEMSWYMALWKTEDIEKRREVLYSTTKVDGDDKATVIEDVLGYEPKYTSYEEFLSTLGGV